MRRAPLVVVALLATVAALVSPAASAAETHAVTGVVLGDGQKPLSGAKVTLTALDNSAQSVVTDASGRYSAEVVPGTYRVDFADDARGYVRETFDDDADARYSSYNQTPVTVVDRDMTGVDAHLVRYGSVSGRILAGGQPVPATYVRLNRRVAGDDYASDFAGPDGRFTLTDVTPGVYGVEFRNGDDESGYELFAHTEVTVPSGGRVDLPTKSFANQADLGRVKGTVTVTPDLDSYPDLRMVAAGPYDQGGGVEVVVQPKQPVDFVRRTPGRYKFSVGQNAWIGGHSFFSAPSVLVSKGKTTTVALEGKRGRDIDAYVQNTRGQGLPGMTVVVYRAGDSTEEVATATTREHGRLALNEVASDSDQVKVTDPSGAYVGRTVTYTREDSEIPVITLQHSPTLPAVSADRSAALLLRSHGVRPAGDWVLYRADDGVAPAPVTVDNSDSDGNSKRHVAPGTYKILLGGHSWYGGRSFGSATPVTLQAGDDKVMDIDGLPSSGHFMGRARGSDGVIATNLMVTTYAADNPDEVVDRTAFDWQFGIYGLPVGPYKLRVTDPTGRYAPTWVGGGTSFATARTITPNISDGTSVGDTTVPLNFVAVTVPSVHNRAAAGLRLTTKSGMFSKTPTSYSRRWYRDGKLISGATGSTYLLTKADVGHRITFRLTGIRKNEPVAPAVSLPTYTVKAR